MTNNVFSGTLNPTQSIDQLICSIAILLFVYFTKTSTLVTRIMPHILKPLSFFIRFTYSCKMYFSLDFTSISFFSYVTCLHCVSKQVPSFKLSVILSNLNRFSKFVHRWTVYEISYKTHTTLSTCRPIRLID